MQLGYAMTIDVSYNGKTGIDAFLDEDGLN